MTRSNYWMPVGGGAFDRHVYVRLVFTVGTKTAAFEDVTIEVEPSEEVLKRLETMVRHRAELWEAIQRANQ